MELTNPRTVGMNLVFLGAVTIAHRHVQDARDRAHQRLHADEYKADLKRYGVELTLEAANRSLLADAREIQEFLKAQRESDARGSEARRMILDPHWDHNDPSAKRLIERELVAESTLTNYLEFGQAAQLLYGDKLPTARLWIHWRDYVIGCVPDGVAQDYVYEFRASTKPMNAQAEEQALRQAHLYAYAFKRPKCKVHLAHFNLPRYPFPIKVRDLPRPETSTILRDSFETDFTRIMFEFDRTFRGAT